MKVESLDQAQLRYLREVLGVEEILWKRPAESHPRVHVFVGTLSPQEKTLMNRMLLAMQLPVSDVQVFESATTQDFQNALGRSPVLALVFGKELSEKLELNFESRGKFIDREGVATIVTYGPTELSLQPELKAEAWKDMKTAMARLK